MKCSTRPFLKIKIRMNRLFTDYIRFPSFLTRHSTDVIRVATCLITNNFFRYNKMHVSIYWLWGQQEVYCPPGQLHCISRGEAEGNICCRGRQSVDIVDQYIGILLHVVYRRKLFNVRIACFIRCNFNHNLVRWSCARMCETNNYWLSTIIKSHTIFLTKRIKMINRIKKIESHCCYLDKNRNTMMNQNFQRTAGNNLQLGSYHYNTILLLVHSGQIDTVKLWNI